jgi:uncharacterized protein YkwD
MRSVVFVLVLAFGAASSFGVLGLRYAPLGLAAEVPVTSERSAAAAIPPAPADADPSVVTDASPDADHAVTARSAGTAGGVYLPAVGVLAAPGTAAGLLESTEKASALFAAMNEARQAAGLPVLAWSDELQAVALARADHLSRHHYFDHFGPDGNSAFAELQARGIAYSLAGENLARNNYPESHTVQTAFDALMASPGHRANILEPRFAWAGVAVVRDGGMWLYVTIFMD